MTDHTLARADEVITELVELVETARTLPMSSSCVLPRERTLDLLDSLREVLPPEMIEARRLVAQRDQALADAQRQAELITRSASQQAAALIEAAGVEADAVLESAEQEQRRLVSADSVFQVASLESQRIRAEADRDSAAVRDAAERYAGTLRIEAESYADRTLSALVANLERLAATAENGRLALAAGSPESPPAASR